VDLFKLKYYLSRRIIDKGHLDFGAPIGLEALTGASPDPKGFERLFQWLGGDQRELDASELNEEFHSTTKILLDEETVLMAFKGGRDVTLFTNIRIMTIDVQGLIGCKIQYTSIPYRSVHAYSVESAGIWDRDSELNLYTRNRWSLAKVDMDFRSGKTDIMQIQQLLSGAFSEQHAVKPDSRRLVSFPVSCFFRFSRRTSYGSENGFQEEEL
jgi:Bacterial PH domain